MDLAELAESLESAASLLPPSERGAANRLRNQATVLGAQQEVVAQMAEIVVTLRVRGGGGTEGGSVAKFIISYGVGCGERRSILKIKDV